MDFEFTEEQKMFQNTVRDFLDKEIAPIVDERDRQGAFTREEVIGYIKKMMPLGYYSLPAELGGETREDPLIGGIGFEELSRVWPSLSGALGLAGMAMAAYAMARGETKEKLGAKMEKGESIGCLAITEPNVGSDTSAIETMLTKSGDRYVVNGTKTWITDGTVADVCIALVQTEKGKGQAGMATVLLDRDISPWEATDFHKIGWRACPTSEMYFDDCPVPEQNIIVAPWMLGGSGQGGGADKAAQAYFGFMQRLNGIRGGMALMSVGIAQAAVDASIKYAKERVQFGKPLGAHQMVQDLVVDMLTETWAARLLSYRAMWLGSKGLKNRMETSLAKGYATEAALRVTGKAIQIHGAMGLSEEYPVERYFRDARMLTMPDGTTQIMKLIVGREVLKIRAYT
jgi:alkylation response protein AidB-like acyl-CoA dehydrogenase